MFVVQACWCNRVVYLLFSPKSHCLPNIMDQTHQLEPFCENKCLFICVLSHNACFTVSPCAVPLSGCAWRMPSAVWKAWKEFGKSTSGSDSSTIWSRDMTASIIVMLLWLQPAHSECFEVSERLSVTLTFKESSRIPIKPKQRFLLDGFCLLSVTQSLAHLEQHRDPQNTKKPPPLLLHLPQIPYITVLSALTHCTIHFDLPFFLLIYKPFSSQSPKSDWCA